MPKKILLISANRCVTPEPVFPLGLGCLSAALRNAGHEICWLDCQVSQPSLEEILGCFRPYMVGVSLRNIDDALIRKRETYYDRISEICATVHRLQPCPIVLGGSGFSILPEALLEFSGADFGIHGEGEESLVALIDALSNGRPYEGVPGLVFRSGGHIRVNPRRHTERFNALDIPDRPNELVKHYLEMNGTLNLQTQRGCSHSCCYCTYPLIEGRTHRRRPPSAIAEEMSRLKAWGAKYVFIVDSIFNSSAQHVVETCEAMVRRNPGISWGCFLRPQGLTRELLKLMVSAGLSHIEFGSDSLCDSVLEAYGKHFTFADILNSHELAREEGVDACHYLICGGPGETLETLGESYRNSQRLEGAVIMAVVGMRIYPATPLFERALLEGLVTVGAQLLAPVYYLAPGLDVPSLFALLGEYAQLSPQWIVGDSTPEYGNMVRKLRQRGVVGPLWSYFSLLQRIRPGQITTS